MSRARLALVIHFHQPVGNLDSVVRDATDRCYRPFLETLDAVPDLKVTLHYSGCLLEWLEANVPDVTSQLRGMAARGQVELMTGGFYEPILAALPERDQKGQIGMLTDHLKDRYAAEPTGLWLAERVWEQDVVPAIVDSGVRYTVVDDTMFHSVGISSSELTGAFVTEHGGKPLLVYAGDRNLRYLIPYKRVARITDHLKAGGEDRLFVYADDGEKFGEWPDTYERVHGSGWLRSFFAELEQQQEWLEIVTLGEDARAAVPAGRVYLPSSSYDEMMTWALPATARLTVGKLRRALAKEDPGGALPFVRGAPWRTFLAKYPEVNHLQKRMLHVSEAVAGAGSPQDAERELYRAQCNCAYWHGAFGGVYLAFMRAALWHHLMRAESSIAAKTEVRVTQTDLDADVREEVLLTGPWGAAVVSPDEGVLDELDDWEVGANLLAVAARHREAYHLEEEGEPGDESRGDEEEMAASRARSEVDPAILTFDERPLGGLIDLIDGQRLTTSFGWGTTDDAVVMTTEHDGLHLAKTIRATGDGLACELTISNRGSQGVRVTYASETAALPLNLGRETGPDELDVSESGWVLRQAEGEVGLAVAVHPMGRVTSEPIQTASASLEGLQTMYQGSIVTTTWEIELGPGESHALRQVLSPSPQTRNLYKKDPGVSA